MADLEALLGHAVVMEEPAMMPYWNPPENFPAAVCVPVSSPTNLLGTLWVFADESRSFDDHQTNILEVIAGRLAAELERETLLREAIEAGRMKRLLSAAAQWQQDQSPAVAPQLAGWDLAGSSASRDEPGAQFFDWFCPAEHQVVAVLGSASGTAVQSALVGTACRIALRCHGQHCADPGRLLTEANRTLWASWPGGQHAAVFCGLIDEQSDTLRYAVAGPVDLMLSGGGTADILDCPPASPLGQLEQAAYTTHELSLSPGSALVVASDGAPPRWRGPGPYRAPASLSSHVPLEARRPKSPLLCVPISKAVLLPALAATGPRWSSVGVDP